MKDLKSKIKEENTELIIWDFDGVIFQMEWNYQSTVLEFMEKLLEKIDSIDATIIDGKSEFISRMFPYPEINKVGILYGKGVQNDVKELFRQKESAALDKAISNDEIINFIKATNIPQVIWSNNLSSSIEYLLKKASIEDKIKVISSLDKVTKSKPDPEGFEIIRKEFPEVDLERILFVGDSERSDKVAAESVGVKFFKV